MIFIARLSIKLKVRARDQHARYIERRGALLRDVLHRIDMEMGHGGLTNVPFKYRLSEAAFAGNALVSVNQSTPYNAVYGRVPKMLSDIEQVPDSGTRDSESLPYPGLLRHSHRLREIALQQMIEGTARARLGRALNTKTLPAGQIEGYKVGEEVDFYRPPSTKDISGWMGPATVVDVSELSRGHISIRFQ